MSLLKIAEALKELNATGMLTKNGLEYALVVAIGEIPREYRDAVVKKIWAECFGFSLPPFLEYKQTEQKA